MSSFYSYSIGFANNRIENFSFPDDPDAIKTQNLVALFQRRRGTLFHVAENGKLIEVKGLKDRLSYQMNKGKEQEAVKKAIGAALQGFNDFLISYKDQEVAEAAVKYLFNRQEDHGIGRLNKRLFNHKLLNQDNILSKYILPPNTAKLQIGNHHFVDITHNKEIIGDSIDLGDETLNHNLGKLFKRTRGTIYQVNEQGKLKKVKNYRDYYESKKEVDKKVQKAVTDTIKGLNIYLQKNKISKTHKVALRQFFSPDSPLCRMNREVFNRSAIEEGSDLEEFIMSAMKRPQMMQQRRNTLEAALKKFRDASDQAKKAKARIEVEEALMDLLFEEFLFTQRLGVDLERVGDGGSGGARYARDRFGRKILVVKPGDEGPHGKNNPQWYARLKRLIIAAHRCLRNNSEPLAEFFSYLFDRKLRIYSVPPTDIRYVTSKQFNGDRKKHCSLQIYVEGSEKCKTLGEYVDISHTMQHLPRSFLRWWNGCENNRGIFSKVPQHENRKKELLEKLPEKLIEKIALHNGGIEDIDCHLGNILVRITEPESINKDIQALFDDESKQKPPNDKIHTFVSDLFTHRGNQELLEFLLEGENVEIDGQAKRVTLIKHDGGDSHPHDHPGSFDWKSLRNNYLFEVLPHFDAPFSEEAKKLVNEKVEAFGSLLLGEAIIAFQNIMQPTVFEVFIRSEKNRDEFKKWIFETQNERSQRSKVKGCLFEALIEVKRKEFEEGLITSNSGEDLQKKIDKKLALFLDQKADSIEFYIDQHLKRIRKNLQTRIDSFRVERKYVNNSTSRRDFFINVRTERDFRRELKELKELKEINDDFDKKMDEWKKIPVQKEDLKPRKDVTIRYKLNDLYKLFGEK